MSLLPRVWAPFLSFCSSRVGAVLNSMFFVFFVGWPIALVIAPVRVSGGLCKMAEICRPAAADRRLSSFPCEVLLIWRSG